MKILAMVLLAQMFVTKTKPKPVADPKGPGRIEAKAEPTQGAIHVTFDKSVEMKQEQTVICRLRPGTPIQLDCSEFGSTLERNGLVLVPKPNPI
jgi:hypothetical protein